MYTKFTLPSGLRILTAPTKGTQTVTVIVLVGTGSKYETKDINGISHFLEHMFFKGTAKRPGFLDISQEIDRIGGVMNAFTSQEYTGYWAKVDAHHFDLVLDVVSDIFLHSTLSEEEINRERRVITEEINMYLDTPMRKVMDLYEEALYGDQPAGWSVLGPKKVIARLARNDFVRYWNEHYTANNTVVCIAGNISVREAYKKARYYFSTHAEREPKEKLAVVEQQRKPSTLVEYKKSDQTHLALGVRTFDMFDRRRYALEILSALLGGGMSSRMFVSVRERQGLAYYVRTEVAEYTDSGFLVTQAGVDNSKADRALTTILEEYKKIARHLVAPQELKKAKNYLKGHMAIELESSDELASWIASQELLEGRVRTPDEVYKKIDAVSREDIRRLAHAIFTPSRLNCALIGPFERKAIAPLMRL